MIYVDSNVPMYMAGADHPNKQRVITLGGQLADAHESFVTSAETFQEIVHRYLAIRDRDHLSAAYEALETLVSRVADVTKQDIDDTRTLSATYPSLSARDALHVVVMRRLACEKLWSYDGAFDAVPSVRRIF